jgi:heme exporter protein B
MSFRRQAWAICRRDLRIEGRAGEVTSVVLPFAAVAVFVVPLATDALDARLDDVLSEIAAPIYWLVALLFGMQVALRQTGTESRTQRRHLVLAGVDPFARFAGRALSASALIMAVLVVTGPLVILFYDPQPAPALLPMLPVLALFAVGLATLATLAGDVTIGLRSRSALAPLIVAPLSVPLLVGAAQSLESVSRGRSTLTGTLLLVIADLALAATAALAAKPLEDATT